MDLQVERPPFYKHIEQNEFSFRKHKKQKEEDIAICVCRYDAADPDSACGESCLNVLTSTECTPGYCPCDIYCKNQRFQKSQYVKSKLFKTEGRGWGLLADEDIKAGQFVIEYCGEVISWKEARRRSQAYEALGLKDAFIISLNAYESIDATKMGSFARFINHSCQPNCETRKWTVLGEIRVGIFAKQDISAGMELSYDYNFEWYGGAKVRCLCGASCCSGFLGAKSRGFQEDTYLWEDDDNRYSVEDIPLYDTEEDEPTSKLLKTNDFLEEMSNGSGKTDLTLSTDHVLYTEYGSHSMPISVVPLNSIPPGETLVSEGNTDIKDHKFQPQSTTHAFVHKNEGISRVRSNSYEVSGPLYRKILHRQGGKVRHLARKQGKQVNVENFGQLLAPKEAQEEVFSAEEARSLATSQLNSLYDEIRPAIEEHEKDSQDCVSTTVAEKWIEASCHKMKADFNLYSIIIKHAICTPRRPLYKATPKPELENENEIKCIEMGEEVVAADKSG